MRGNMDLEWLFVDGCFGLRKGARRLIQIGVMRTPDPVAGPDATKTKRAVAKAQFQLTITLRRNLIDAAAFFRFFWAAPIGGIKHNAITGFQRRHRRGRFGRDDHAVGQDARDLAHQYTAVAGITTADNGLVVRAADKKGAQATGIDLL